MNLNVSKSPTEFGLTLTIEKNVCKAANDPCVYELKLWVKPSPPGNVDYHALYHAQPAHAHTITTTCKERRRRNMSG